MPFEQLHIFLIRNRCIQAPDMELKAMDCVFPCSTGRILRYAQSRTVQTSSYYTAPVHVADKPTAQIHVYTWVTSLRTRASHGQATEEGRRTGFPLLHYGC
jgi:hypothetical protein